MLELTRHLCYKKLLYFHVTANYDGIVKRPDAALRCILRHCGVP